MPAEKLPSWLKREGEAILFNGPGEFVFYIPDKLFTSKYVELVGEYVKSIGIMDYAVFDENGKTDGVKSFRFPTVFLSKPNNITKIKRVKLKAGVDAKDYRALHFYNGDAIVVDTSVPQDIENVEDFYKVFLYGNLPNTIPYDELQNYFVESMALNGSSYGVSLQMFGFIISEMFRSKNDLSVAFRHTKFTDPTSYRPISIKELPKFISPNSSIGSENWDNGVVGAIVHPTDKHSPMEQLVMGNTTEESSEG